MREKILQFRGNAFETVAYSLKIDSIDEDNVRFNETHIFTTVLQNLPLIIILRIH